MDAKFIAKKARAVKSFNPRARDGREQTGSATNKQGMVSIHAPVMDANDFLTRPKGHGSVSIHAPVMDAKNF